MLFLLLHFIRLRCDDCNIQSDLHTIQLLTQLKGGHATHAIHIMGFKYKNHHSYLLCLVNLSHLL